MEEKDVEKTEEIVEQVEKKSKESKLHKLTSWYIEYKKPIIGALFTLTAICWLTAKVGLTKLVLYIGKLGRPEYTDFYMDYRDEFLNTKTNLVMTEFRTVLFVVGILLLIGSFCVNNYYERGASPATGQWMINFGLITLGFSMVTYGVLLLGLYKIYSISALIYILIGVLCFVLLPCADKDFDADHPDRYEFKIGSYVCGVLAVILVVAIGFGNVRKDVNDIKEAEEKYTKGYHSAVTFLSDWEDTSENGIYVMLHFYNKHNGDLQDFDYYELKESYLNLVNDNGKSWMLWKKFSNDYFDVFFGRYVSEDDGAIYDAYDMYDDAVRDYVKLVAQQLYYEGYLYGNDFEQPMLGEEILYPACEMVDTLFSKEKTVETYTEDITITVKQPLVVGENVSFDVSCPENNGEYHAYMMKIGRVNYVGSVAMIEEKDCMSDEEFIIKDNSVYQLEFKIMTDVYHSLGEDIKVSVEGIDYEDMTVISNHYEYRDGNLGTQKEGVYVSLWVTTGECDGTYEIIEDLKIDVPEGFCQGDSIEAVSGLDTVMTDNPNVIVNKVSWSAKYPKNDLDGETKFSHEPKMYILYTTLLGETGYGFTEDTVGFINEKKLPKYDSDLNDFWSGGYVRLWQDRLRVGMYYYRITTDTKYYGISGTSKHGGLGVSYDYATAGTIVTLDPQPAHGYKFKEYRVELEIDNAEKYENWKPVIENNTFVMPAAPIKITAVFEKE